LSHSLEETGVFPELAYEMTEVGESTGALPAMLTSVSEFFEEDVQTALSAALSLIEPLILIVMGIVVATVLIALYLPIFSLGAQASG
jgi:type IV pilus assembly protein PilC